MCIRDSFLAYAQQFKEDFNALEAEHANLLAAMDRAYKLEAWEVVTGFGRAICPPATGYLYVRGYWTEARRRLAQAAEAARRLGDHHSEGAFANATAAICANQGDLDQARQEYERALRIAREHGYRQGEAATLHQLGILAQDTGDYDQARRLYQQSLDIAQQLGDKDGNARSLAQLGRVAELEKDDVTAVRYWTQALELLEALGAPEREIVRGWFARLREELGEDRFNEVLEEAAKGSRLKPAG